MARINENFQKLKAGYLFPEIARRVNAYTEAEPEKAKRLIRCGIGDVTEPVPVAAREAMKKAVDELGERGTFRGYGPEQGYPFLRETIAKNAYAGLGIDAGDIFVSDGSKCDSGNILDIFGPGNKIAVTDPVYPVYVDTNVMAGNTGEANEAGEYAGLLQPASSSKLGSLTRKSATRFFSMMQPTRPSFRMTPCPVPFMRSKVPRIARLSSAPSPRMAASLESVVLTP